MLGSRLAVSYAFFLFRSDISCALLLFSAKLINVRMGMPIRIAPVSGQLWQKKVEIFTFWRFCQLNKKYGLQEMTYPKCLNRVQEMALECPCSWMYKVTLKSILDQS